MTSNFLQLEMYFDVLSTDKLSPTLKKYESSHHEI